MHWQITALSLLVAVFCFALVPGIVEAERLHSTAPVSFETPPDSLSQALLSAAARGDLDAVIAAMEKGVPVDTRSATGLTPLHLARINGREEVGRILLEHGADESIPVPPFEDLATSLFEEAVSKDAPGAAVLVASDGQVLFERGFGLANKEDGIPITPDTQFRIGSITKQFTAAAILKLISEGKISLEDRLSRFFPDFPRAGEVTIHHLLTHTSGIHSYTDRVDFITRVTEEVEPESLIELIKEMPYDFDPGESWRYNNSGYYLLGLIVEKASGKSYEDYLRESFFEPIGMTSTGLYRKGLELQNEAFGYDCSSENARRAFDWNMSWAGAAGALYSTVRDLHRWNEALYTGSVLDPALFEAMLTPVKLNSGETAPAMGGGYGYGLAINKYRGLEEISHGGGLHGFQGNLVRYPEHNLTVAILTNCLPQGKVDPSSFARRLAEYALWEVMEPQVSYSTSAQTIDLNKLVGRYQYPGGAVLEVTREGDRLFAQLTGQAKYEIFQRAGTEFEWRVVDAQIIFVLDQNGNVSHGIHRQGGREFRVDKLP